MSVSIFTSTYQKNKGKPHLSKLEFWKTARLSSIYHILIWIAKFSLWQKYYIWNKKFDYRQYVVVYTIYQLINSTDPQLWLHAYSYLGFCLRAYLKTTFLSVYYRTESTLRSVVSARFDFRSRIHGSNFRGLDPEWVFGPINFNVLYKY